MNNDESPHDILSVITDNLHELDHTHVSMAFNIWNGWRSRGKSPRKVPRLCHLSQHVERRAHMDVVVSRGGCLCDEDSLLHRHWLSASSCWNKTPAHEDARTHNLVRFTRGGLVPVPRMLTVGEDAVADLHAQGAVSERSRVGPREFNPCT